MRSNIGTCVCTVGWVPVHVGCTESCETVGQYKRDSPGRLLKRQLVNTRCRRQGLNSQQQAMASQYGDQAAQLGQLTGRHDKALAVRDTDLPSFTA